MAHELLRCVDIMTPAVFTVAPDQDARKAAGLMLREHVSGCPVIEGGRVVGVLSEMDLLRALYTAVHDDTPPGTVRDHMTPYPVELREDATVEQAAHLFFEYPYRRAPVVDGSGALLGVVSRRDVLVAYEELARSRALDKG